jgi:hypothetical protein
LDIEYFDCEKSIRNLITMVGDKNPELINDGKETAPSKRILKEIPEYDKVTAGVSCRGDACVALFSSFVYEFQF